MRSLFCSALLLLSCALASPAQAAPVTAKRGMTRYDYKMARFRERQGEQGAHILLLQNRQAADLILRSMARIEPLMRPDTQVDEAELPELRKQAALKAPQALVRLGHYYMMHPVGENEQLAGEYFRKAAETMDGDALAWLAVYNYVITPSTEANWSSKIERCRTELMESARRGSALGEYLVALTLTGSSPEKISWLEKAARKGFVPAMRALGEAIAEYNYRNVKELRQYYMTPEAKAWLKLAADSGDAAAWGLLSTEGAHENRRLELDFRRLESCAQKEWELAQKFRWNWYGHMFDERMPVGRYAWGGPGPKAMLDAFSHLSALYHRQNKPQAELVEKMKQELGGLADAGHTDAMLAVVKAAESWKSFFPHIEEPCPFDPRPYLKRLQEKAEAGDVHLSRRLAD